ncbi:5'/3'-nucleotidase SurE [Sneathiella sp. P13V-1]|uniref:5'/3'-nucleotidase SurE n=1 Tax=Sneathiella sp. P13V-1 TaxID=2697366 RepID=UPI00187B2298|nr:5'/3'-nucleotidase SurE [Sneathiella sp. P13V-1]MBE7637677.1 5'/3'-nucleotidase SurE [Sneathiella sp. P13V-1]
MRILLSNDDGYDAPGMQVLRNIAAKLSDDVIVVAPAKEQSGASRSLTLHDPIRIQKFSDTEYAVEGTPTDCVMMALNNLFKDNPPDLILSGVNRGANLGEDVLYSGTVAAASEGTLLGVKSIAISQCILDAEQIYWETTEKLAPEIIKKLLEKDWGAGTLININFPPVPVEEVRGTEVTVQGQRDLSNLLIDSRVDARGRDYYWLGYRPSLGEPGEGSDLHAVSVGKVAITPLNLNLTDKGLMGDLNEALS